MKVSLAWFRELCDVDASAQVVAERLTSGGFEVEGLVDLQRKLDKIVVVEVADVQPHPNADRLKIVKVLDGQGTRTIVCGAPDVTVGARVPLAEPGALIGERRIEVAEVRGVSSAGMLCSERELGISDDASGLCQLPADWVLGKDLKDTVLGDVLLDVGVTPNRPDALSHLGLARELAALFGARVRRPRVVLREEGGDVGERVAVEILDQNACRRYVARVVTGVKIVPSPLAIRARLFALGIRPINNVVDATNWVLLELGHPLHAFDLGKLAANGKQKKISVRRAHAGEKLSTLDGVVRELADTDLVVADGAQAQALAGVMGGVDSEIGERTVDVLVESAYFEPAVVYQTSKRHGLVTEASNRFWRGTDLEGLALPNERACQLIAELGGGKVCRGAADVYPRRRQAVEVSVRPQRVNAYLGVQVSAEDLAGFLTALELTVKARTDVAITFGIPSFRSDLTGEVDLIEEVARLYGYAKIPERLPNSGGDYSSPPPRVPGYGRVREMLLSFGLCEAKNYSFVSKGGEALFRPQGLGEAVALANPMAENESVMRTSLLPGLLVNARHNHSRQVSEVRLFEIGRVFYPRSERERQGLDPRDAMLPREENRLGVILGGPAAPFGWGMPARQVDFFDLKRVAHFLFESCDVHVRYVATDLPSFLHPKAAAGIVCDVGGTLEMVGFMGQVHPRALRGMGVDGPFFVLDVDAALLARETQPKRYRQLPRFPGIRRDLAVIVPDSQPSGALLDFVRARAADGGLLEDIKLFDVYQGKPIQQGHSSLALAFFFRHPDRTLTDEEVQQQFESLIDGLKAEFSLTVRESQ